MSALAYKKRSDCPWRLLSSCRVLLAWVMSNDSAPQSPRFFPTPSAADWYLAASWLPPYSVMP
ncbi:hypothetical protein D3C75_987120 [compost metagenome]